MKSQSVVLTIILSLFISNQLKAQQSMSQENGSTGIKCNLAITKNNDFLNPNIIPLELIHTQVLDNGKKIDSLKAEYQDNSANFYFSVFMEVSTSSQDYSFSVGKRNDPNAHSVVGALPLSGGHDWVTYTARDYDISLKCSK